MLGSKIGHQRHGATGGAAVAVAVAVLVGVCVGGTGVCVGGTGVLVGGTGVFVGGAGGAAGTEVFVAVAAAGPSPAPDVSPEFDAGWPPPPGLPPLPFCVLPAGAWPDGCGFCAGAFTVGLACACCVGLTLAAPTPPRGPSPPRPPMTKPRPSAPAMPSAASPPSTNAVRRSFFSGSGCWSNRLIPLVSMVVLLVVHKACCRFQELDRGGREILQNVVLKLEVGVLRQARRRPHA